MRRAPISRADPSASLGAGGASDGALQRGPHLRKHDAPALPRRPRRQVRPAKQPDEIFAVGAAAPAGPRKAPARDGTGADDVVEENSHGCHLLHYVRAEKGQRDEKCMEAAFRVWTFPHHIPWGYNRGLMTTSDSKIDVLFDMETSDPDDFFALCFLTSHPAVRIRAVTITPGTIDQVGLVRLVLDRAGLRNIPVGSRSPDHAKRCVSIFHYRLLRDIPPSKPDGLAYEIMAHAIKSHPNTTILTGGPLHNLRLLLENQPRIRIARWIAQGGFAGKGVVPPEDRLAEFGNRETCQSYNFGGDDTLSLLQSRQIAAKYLVSKNVTHGVLYDKTLHERLARIKNKPPGMQMIYDGMDLYLKSKNGKAFHDPLAACVVVDPDVCQFKEVEMFRKKTEWGARLKTGTSMFISIHADMERFIRRLMIPSP